MLTATTNRPSLRRLVRVSAAQANPSPAVRWGRVVEARRRLVDGDLDRAACLDLALDKMIDRACADLLIDR